MMLYYISMILYHVFSDDFPNGICKKSVMSRNFGILYMKNVDKFEISPFLERFWMTDVNYQKNAQLSFKVRFVMW